LININCGFYAIHIKTVISSTFIFRKESLEARYQVCTLGMVSWKLRGYYKKIWSKLLVSDEIPEYLLKLRKNPFTKEVVLYPNWFCDRGYLPSNMTEVLSECNLLGWISFFLHDILIDNEAKEFVNNSDQLLLQKKKYEQIYLEKLEEISNNSNICKSAKKAYKIMEIETVSGVTEVSVIERSKPYYLSLKSILNKNVRTEQLFKDLDTYLLLKQYNDDVKDFREDVLASRYSLLTTMVQNELGAITHEDQVYAFYLDSLVPNVVKRMLELLETVCTEMNEYPPFFALKKNLLKFPS